MAAMGSPRRGEGSPSKQPDESRRDCAWDRLWHRILVCSVRVTIARWRRRIPRSHCPRGASLTSLGIPALAPLTDATNARNFDSSHVATSRHSSTSAHDPVEHASELVASGHSEKHPSTRKGSQPFGNSLRPLEATARSDRRSTRSLRAPLHPPVTRLRRGSLVNSRIADPAPSLTDLVCHQTRTRTAGVPRPCAVACASPGLAGGCKLTRPITKSPIWCVFAAVWPGLDARRNNGRSITVSVA